MVDALDDAVGPDRRTFLRRAVAAAFVAPTVTSFTMSGIAAVFGWAPDKTTLGASPNCTTLAINPNGTSPPAPSGYETFGCFTYTGGQGTINFSSGPDENPSLTFPTVGILPFGTRICVYKGDLDALAPTMPAGHTLLSAWAILWHGPCDTKPVATQPITMTIANSPVDTTHTIYDTTGGGFASAGAAGSGEWDVQVTEDPTFVVTSFTPPADDASAPAAVVAQPATTG